MGDRQEREQVEVTIQQRIMVDPEIAEEIVWLNENGVRTEGSCSGHGEFSPVALIIPSSVERAKELGYTPWYLEDQGLYEIKLQGREVIFFDVKLDDERVARCWRAQAQSYADAEFSAGLVDGIEPDIFYLRLEKDGDEPLTLFLRRDELLALVWVASGAMWSEQMLERNQDH